MTPAEIAAGSGVCWKCRACGEVDCRESTEISKYGELTECTSCYAERLEEITWHEGLAVMADKALIALRQASRDLQQARADFARAERKAKVAARAILMEKNDA